MAELKPMTIDEHIKHHLDLEKMWENGAKRAKDDGLIYAFEMHTMIATDHRHLADWLRELKEAKSIIRTCNRVLAYLLECEIESTSTRYEVETLLKNIGEYLSGGGENG